MDWIYSTFHHTIDYFCNALSNIFIRRCNVHPQFEDRRHAVVLHAIIGLGKKLTPDKTRIAIALASAFILLIYPSAWLRLLIILGAGLIGLYLFNGTNEPARQAIPVSFSKKTGLLSISALVVILICSPIVNSAVDNRLVDIFDTFFRVGSLVFGGGHVVLPMIEREIVPGDYFLQISFLLVMGWLKQYQVLCLPFQATSV